jgi:hypothetical protein
MKSMSLEDYHKSIERKYLASRSSKILHLQSNGGWLPREGSTDDPNGTTDITDTTDAQKASIASLLDVFNNLNSLTRQTLIDSLTKAHANAAGTTPATTQKFRKRSK